MDKAATDKAARRIEKIRGTIAILETSTPEAIEDAWEEFVLAAGSFYSAIEQGSKKTAKSKAWFAKKKHERRTNPMLRYIHHARNAEEHGLARITGRFNSKIELSPGGSVTVESDGKKTWKVVDSEGEIKYANDIVGLVPVKDDRFGDVFEPPDEYQGSDGPILLAKQTLDYLEEMHREAITLIA
jgi:hypothetical protein